MAADERTIYSIGEEALRNVIQQSGGGGAGGGDMTDRVTRLETHFEYVRRDLDSIKVGVDELRSGFKNLPTKGDLTVWRWQWTAVSVAAVAVIIGGIIGGLDWIKPDPLPLAPIVIQTVPLAPDTSTAFPLLPE